MRGEAMIYKIILVRGVTFYWVLNISVSRIKHQYKGVTQIFGLRLWKGISLCNIDVSQGLLVGSENLHIYKKPIITYIFINNTNLGGWWVGNKSISSHIIENKH